MKKYKEEMAIGYNDILLIPRYSDLQSRNEVDISENFSSEKIAMPLIMSPMNCVTSPQMIYFFLKNDMVATVHRYFKEVKDQYDYVYLGLSEMIRLDNKGIDLYDFEQRKKMRQGVVGFTSKMKNAIREEIEKIYFSVGSVFKYKEWIDFLLNKGIKRFCIDMAHGDSKHCVDTIAYIRKFGKDIKIMAGNIATKEGFLRLCDAGVNSVRVGIGSGNACTTRGKEGFGVPMVSCLQDICQGTDIDVIADGGINTSGDIVKALYCGARAVMLGKMLAATDLSSDLFYNKKMSFIPKDKINFDDKNSIYYPEYKRYMGMASKDARNGVLSEGSVEGVSGYIKYQGKTETWLKQLKMNLKSALSYGGCKNWKQFRKEVEYIVISQGGKEESNTHLDIYK